MKIICVGRNYIEHINELNNKLPTKPLLFMKPDTALLQTGKPFFYPEFSNNIHFECELVVRIGKQGKHIAEKFAHRYISHFTLGIDLTARDLQDDLKNAGHPWEIAKGFDNSAIIGELQPFNSQEDLQSMQFKLLKNKEIVQNGNTSSMIFSIQHLISYVSCFFTLRAGDLIFTGTPAGVGPISIGDSFEAFLEDKLLLSFMVK